MKNEYANNLLICLNQRKGRKNKKTELPVESKDVQDAIDVLLDDEAAAAVDACARKHCGAGRECRVNEEGKAECRCVAACPEEKDPRRMVNTSHFLRYSFASFA